MQEVGRDTGSSGHRSLAPRPAGPPVGRAAVARFQLAAVRLAAAGSKDGSTWTFDALGEVTATRRELEAGRALLEVAEADEQQALGQLLRADPACTSTSWTVACYRIGDLVPHALRDFTDPVAAVRTLVDCGDEEHLASELVASTPDGLCWAALVRTGEQVRFQLFGPHSVLGRPGRHGLSEGEQAAVAAAQAGWAALLASWHTSQGAAGPFFQARLALGTHDPTRAPAVGASDPGGLVEASADSAGDGLVGPPIPEATGPWMTVGAAGRWAATGTGSQLSAMEMFFGIAATLSDLTDTVSGITEVVERLELSVGALASRLDLVAPSSAAQQAPAPLGHAGSVVLGGPEPVREPARRWWALWHRDTRRRPAVGRAAARSL